MLSGSTWRSGLPLRTGHRVRFQPAVESQEMTAKELLRQRIDELSEAEAESALRLIDEHTGEADEPEMAPLPQGWGETLTGEPMPNVTAAVSRSRETH